MRKGRPRRAVGTGRGLPLSHPQHYSVVSYIRRVVGIAEVVRPTSRSLSKEDAWVVEARRRAGSLRIIVLITLDGDQQVVWEP